MGPPFVGNETLASLRSTVGMVLDGFEDHGMPAFAGTLDDHEIAAVSTFARNSWGSGWRCGNSGRAAYLFR